MSLEVFCDAPYDNNAAWLAFQMAHFLRHQTIADAVTSRITQSRLDNIQPGDISWMIDHQQTHFDICNALGINANPFLGETDLTDPSLYESWMLMHKTEHALFDRALGL